MISYTYILFLLSLNRCFLSGGAPACSPSKSRIVEAILIHLLEDITQPRREVDERGKNKYTSRYKLVLSAYNSIRARVLNSDILMQRTNLMLVNLNEFTLLRWYKNSIRRDEIKLLMQGFTLPQPQPCTNDPLLPAKILPTSPPAPPEDCHIFHEVDDQTGLARLRDKSSTQVIIAPTTPVTIPATSGTTSATLIDPAAIPTTSGTTIPRVTQWRHRKAGKDHRDSKRKIYCCSVCNQPVSSEGHAQYRGYRYCQYAPGQVPHDVWLAEKKAKFIAKRKI